MFLRALPTCAIVSAQIETERKTVYVNSRMNACYNSGQHVYFTFSYIEP
jgi:hypothetical protein